MGSPIRCVIFTGSGGEKGNTPQSPIPTHTGSRPGAPRRLPSA